MKRRKFSGLLALGAGAMSVRKLSAGEATEEEAAEAAAPDSEVRAVCVKDYKELARDTLPQATYDYITTGSEDEVTLRENVEAFRRIRLLPPLLEGVSQADLTTTVLGAEIALPVLLAPVAGLRMFHPEGALAAARAAATAQTVVAVSTSAGSSVEEVAAAATGPKWFQLYCPKDRGVTRRLVERVGEAGYHAIVVTVDLGERKDADRRNRFSVPKEMLLKHLVDVGHTELNAQMTYQQLLDFNDQAWDLSLSWDFFDWLRSITDLPILLKGVLRPDDALRAVSIGLDGVVVSNHGGRRLDGVPSSIEVLPKIVEVVGDRAEVLLDGGVRRGADVFKALALGARAVLIGRPYAWALAADGQRGVRSVLRLLEEELENAMIASGCRNLDALQPGLLQAGGTG
jgi:4-hydroxymandelate oxidase